MSNNGTTNGKLPHVFVALPARPGDQMHAGILTATHNMGPGCTSQIKAQSCSLLTTNFNLLWCDALNMRPRPDLFCMCHDDVIPEDGWLGALVAERQRTGADILSVCVPMKDERGLTSTGVMDWDTRRMRKFSVAETLRFPRSFDAAGAGHPGKVLLLNTGLWVCDFTRPWVESMCFRQKDAIVRQANGKFRPVSVSEDWLFSIDAARLGLKTMATTSVKVKHLGGFAYPNFAAWGTGKSEEDEAAAIAWDINAPEAWGLEREPIGIPQEVTV